MLIKIVQDKIILKILIPKKNKYFKFGFLLSDSIKGSNINYIKNLNLFSNSKSDYD